MKILSPAKINLFLTILGKRMDGYHNIHTLFERVNLFDEVTLTKIKSGIVVDMVGARRAVPLRIPTGPKNLAYRAAKLLKDEFGIKSGVRIQIKKRIPVAAGLGGGSSNAAATLLGLNRLWKLNLSKKALSQLASSIGSDCAFFVMQTSFAEGRGRGEILRKVEGAGGKIWHVLVKPHFGISTKSAYQAYKTPTLTPKSVSAKMLLQSFRKGQAKRLSGLCSNSLELVLGKRVREIIKFKEKLKNEGALASLMSGSGSTVFGLFRSKRKAILAAQSFKPKKGQQVFVVSTY